MVYLGREVTPHQHALDARARAPSSPRSPLCPLRVTVHCVHRATAFYILVYKRGHCTLGRSISQHKKSSTTTHYRVWNGNIGHGWSRVSCCQSASGSALRLVSAGAGVGHGGMRLACRQHQKYLSDLVVRFSTSLALFTEKPRNIVRKLKAPFRPILPEN